MTFSAPDTLLFVLSDAALSHFAEPVAKKSRASVLSDEDDEAEMSRSETNSIPVTSSRRTSSILSGSEDDTPARARKANLKSLAARRAGKARSDKSSTGVSSGYDSDDFIAVDNDEEDPRPRAKPKAKTKASKDAASQLSVQTTGPNNFLTAAEQRAQSKKEGKKATESTYTFLQVRKDVSVVLPTSLKIFYST